jgi:hypothetical protein
LILLVRDCPHMTTISPQIGNVKSLRDFFSLLRLES